MTAEKFSALINEAVMDPTCQFVGLMIIRSMPEGSDVNIHSNMSDNNHGVDIMADAASRIALYNRGMESPDGLNVTDLDVEPVHRRQ